MSKYELPVIREAVPERYRHIVDRAEAGSVKAAVTLHCAFCTAWHLAEVRDCRVTSCPLHHLRRVAKPKRELSVEQRSRMAKQAARRRARLAAEAEAAG